MDWYCSGIWGGDWGEGLVNPEYVEESVVTDEVWKDLVGLGWTIKPYELDWR
jgi:hypothetical protein